ncbi:hypothetical protein DE146DRAFT_615947 [Phaeosphaeria sp. MPI-PUGE-AT-0046c]|nr:hypothetical protein DE146DRAFT_615947 [Phaeosphaeria sp. MPI-PUGE-AT-0046c]
MPTEEENTQYLYLILTHGGNPTVDWDAVSAAMDLKKGAVSKRWSRLKKSMEAGEAPSGSVYKFLWLCVKHSPRDKAPNWNEIAEKCGTTSGAASKRYSRMKQAFEAGGDPAASGSASSGAKTPAKATPKRLKGAAADSEGTPTPKRKRANAKKKEEEVKKGLEEDDTKQVQSAKKPKVIRKKTAVESKAADEGQADEDSSMSMAAPENSNPVKTEVEDDGEGDAVDVKE